MCNRFIESFVDKVIEKTDLENLDTKALIKVTKRCKAIIEKREKDLLAELEKIYKFDKYVIRGNSRNKVTINSSSERGFGFHYYNENINKYILLINNTLYNKFPTKEKLLDQLLLFIDLPHSKKLYDICLEKLNIMEELATITTF